jgi:hypothetical protein
MIVDTCFICKKEIEDFDLVFTTEDGKYTVCSGECNTEYQERLNNES